MVLKTALIFSLLCILTCYSDENFLSGHCQLLVVTSDDWEKQQGSLQLYAREHDQAAWMSVGSPICVALGRTGLAWGIGLHPRVDQLVFCKKEGDGKSPAGAFSLGSAFGFAPCSEMNHLKIDYFQLNQHIEAVDDPNSSYYNYIVDRREVISNWRSAEKMGEEPLYALGIVINHNFPEPEAERGSAIFLHIWRSEDANTAGCTAMSLENLTTLLSWLDKNKRPILIQLPIQAYKALQNAWNLPFKNNNGENS